MARRSRRSDHRLWPSSGYGSHVAETGREQKEYPAIFTRWADSLIAHGDPLVRPTESTRFDYEGELAVVIGKGGRRIPRSS